MIAVKPQILVWARETAGLDLDEAARKIYSSSKSSSAVDKMRQLERGERQLTQRQLYKLAKAYHQPQSLFYLPEPPRDWKWGADFRTVPEGGFDHKGNARMHLLLRNMLASQGIMSDLLEHDEDTGQLPYVGSMNIADGVDRIAEDIVKTIGFAFDAFRSERTVRDAFGYLRGRLESAGIFVLLQCNLGSHHTDIPPEVFRGFALADKYAPYIVINRKDAVSAWSFTALHEATHLWLGNTSVSGAWGELEIERFCNQVAASILLPAHELDTLPPMNKVSLDMAAETISDFADGRNISRTMVAYNLWQRGRIRRSRWLALWDRFRQEWLEHKAREQNARRDRDGGPSYYTVRRFNLGPRLTSYARDFLHSPELTPTKAGILLRVPTMKVYPLLDPNYYDGRL
ncbi:MAG: ImmA/IrrE family metallo-endopeptidase [Chloroflexi bacterium]|nr:ImmA/IrrE family metallo-endopeptidase [Chloroflexota bacterium]